MGMRMAGHPDRPFSFLGGGKLLGVAFVFWGSFLQGGEQGLGAGWDLSGVFEDYFAGHDFLAVEFLVGVIVWTKS